MSRRDQEILKQVADLWDELENDLEFLSLDLAERAECLTGVSSAPHSLLNLEEERRKRSEINGGTPRTPDTPLDNETKDHDAILESTGQTWNEVESERKK